jgi:hypothetical protein
LFISSQSAKQTWPPQAILVSDTSTINRRPSIDFSYQVSIYLAMQFQDFLEIGQSETRIACGGHVCLADWVKKHGRHRQFLFLIS